MAIYLVRKCSQRHIARETEIGAMLVTLPPSGEQKLLVITRTLDITLETIPNWRRRKPSEIAMKVENHIG
jgi:hypothetical protein